MDNIILPESGSVVVIDDQINEALPIIKLLSKKGIASTYYSGTNDDELPNPPIQKVRIVFLDLQLFPSNDAHVIATNLVNKLKKIISPENGPYLLIIWSQKRALYAQDLRNEVNKPEHKIVPAGILEFEKSDCLRRVSNEDNTNDLLEDIKNRLESRFQDDELLAISEAVQASLAENDDADILYEANENAFSIIEKNIKEQLIQAGAFHLFVLWENIINQSAGFMIEKISSSTPMDKEWEKNMGSIFYQMGRARVNKKENDLNIILKESLKTFNYSFIDTVENKISSTPFPQHIKVNKDNLLISSIGTDLYKLNVGENGFHIEKNGSRIVEGKTLEKIIDNLKNETDKPNVENLLKQFIAISPSLNTTLHIEMAPYGDIFPGNVYERNEGILLERKKEIILRYVNEIKNIDDFKLIELEVSPICDFAQDNMERSRRVSGLLYEISNKLNSKVESGSKNGSYYSVEPVFMLDKKLYKMIFSQRRFKSIELSDIKDKPIFRIKRELLLDIVAHLSSHVNRPGIMFVK